MKRGKSYDWIPLWIDKWLMGSTRFELEPGERSVFIDLMALGAKDDGYIRANPMMGYPHEYLTRILNVTPELLEGSISKCVKHGKIKELKNGIYYVKNWQSYSLSSRHKRRVMSENADIASAKADGVSGKADALSVSVLSKSSSLFFNKNLKVWEGITEKDRAGWGEAYPACDIDIELAKMREWILANGAKGKKSNYRRFITNWLSRTQDRGGGGGGGGNRPDAGLPGRDVFKAQYEKHKAKEGKA